jgi:hypothetical protein
LQYNSNKFGAEQIVERKYAKVVLSGAKFKYKINRRTYFIFNSFDKTDDKTKIAEIIDTLRFLAEKRDDDVKPTIAMQNKKMIKKPLKIGREILKIDAIKPSKYITN